MLLTRPNPRHLFFFIYYQAGRPTTNFIVLLLNASAAKASVVSSTLVNLTLTVFAESTQAYKSTCPVLNRETFIVGWTMIVSPRATPGTVNDTVTETSSATSS